MTNRTSALEARALREDRQHVGELLSFYPEVSESQVQEIASFITVARDRDLSLLMADELIARKLITFMEDHRNESRVKLEGPIIVAVLLFMLAATVWFLGTYGVQPTALIAR